MNKWIINNSVHGKASKLMNGYFNKWINEKNEKNNKWIKR